MIKQMEPAREIETERQRVSLPEGVMSVEARVLEFEPLKTTSQDKKLNMPGERGSGQP